METALILCRFLQFALAMLLWGAAVLRAGAFPADLLQASSALAVRLGRFAAGVNLLAALAWLAVEAALAGGGPWDAVNPDVLAALLTGSRFGQVWVLHLALAVVLLGVSLADRPRGLALSAGLNLGSLGLTGHAVLPGGWIGLVHQGLSVLHLLAAGFWLGGLAVVLPFLTSGRLTEAGAPVLRYFSRWGHLAVALVLATGVAKAALILTARGGFDPAAGYLGFLLVKSVAVLVMVGLALRNRYRHVPRLSGSEREVALDALRRGTLGEIGLAVAVLALVSVLATWSPFAAT